jgi:serine/threonine-protein kinase
VAATTTSRRFGLSLETRIFLVSSLLIALLVGGAVAVTSILLQRAAHAAAADSLKTSASVQATYERERYERLKLGSRLFLTNENFVAYLAQASKDNDVASLLDFLGDGQKELGFDFAIVLDPVGKVVARTDKPSAVGEDLKGRPLVAKALADFEAFGVWREGDRLYHAVAVPVTKNFTSLGFLVTGFAITDESAREVNRVSGADAAYVALGPKSMQVVGTNLPPPLARGLEAALGESADGEIAAAIRAGRAVPPRELSLRGERWLVQASPLREADGRPIGAAVALDSLERELASYRKIQNTLLGSGLAAVLLAPFLSYAFTRRAMGPVRRLVAATEAARQGDYDQKIDSERTDEVGSLSRAFRDLLTDLREKRDMEAYVTDLSRNLPEPQAAQIAVGEPQHRELVLLGVELRAYARAAGEETPRQTLDRLAADLERVSAAVAGQRGQLETVSGHRALARFEGRDRAQRALAAAARILKGVAEEAAPAVALASGRAVTGPVRFGERAERATVGLPVQQLESLLREAAPGDLLLGREVYAELKEVFERAGYQLAARRGMITPQPLYVVNAAMAERVSGSPGMTTPAHPEAVVLGTHMTLSGVAPGALLGRRFEILAVLGSGGMGVVYKARDRELDDLVALKMLKAELWGDQGQLERLKSEIKLARKITHPNVLRTYDFGEIDDVPYISMEYVRGVTLRYMLDQTHRLPYSAGLRLGKQLAAGLGAAHAVGVLHRDIKPENLILEPTGNAKLMDFGIARPIERMAPGQTQAGFIVGTPQYLPPEVLQGEPASPRSDIYSCGVVLYEIFTGVLPFAAPTAMEVILQHLKEEPAAPSAHWPEIPKPLEAAILRCLRKDPEQRFRSVEELLQQLENLKA